MNVALEAVTKRFGPVTAADGVSLEIRHGESFFLLGPSGCGKTTLLRMIAGFCAPDAGVIRFDGERVNDLPPHRRNTGMVFQNYALWPHLTVYENVAFGLTVPGRAPPAAERRRRVLAMLERVQMAALADRLPQRLSGGQQQRVALARALVIDPACLLLDEPLSNLDAKLREEMRLEIRQLVRRLGITTVYVTHDQKEALAMADRCAILRQGRVAQVGPPRELYERPADRFVAEFLGGANLIPGVLRACTAEGATVETAFGCWTAVPPRDTGRVGDPVTLAVRPETIRVAAPGGAAGSNAFRGRLEDTVYLGAATEAWVRMADGCLLKALAPGAALPAAPGADLPFTVASPDVVVLTGA